MDPRVAAETHRTAKDRRARQMRFARAADDRLIQRPVAPWFLVALADEDAEQHAILRFLHRTYSCRGAGWHRGDDVAGRERGWGLTRAGTVEQHVRPLECDDTLPKHRLNFREQCLDTRRFINDFDDNGEFLRDGPCVLFEHGAFRAQAKKP